ncbi:MAG: IMP cyclohydrolase [Victivallaceae bacterium]
MYLGRIVAIGMTKEGCNAAMYRVSSRSFPNREARLRNHQVSIMPRPGFEADLQKNPYITYNCIRLAGEFAVVSNGSHTDPVAEKVTMGMPVRDAMAFGLMAMDYEKDAFDTPRIVGAVHRTESIGFLGIVRKDALLVREFKLEPGKVFYISTYEHNYPAADFNDPDFRADGAAEAARFLIDGGIFKGFEHPVTAAAAFAGAGTDFELAALTI